MWNDLSYVGDTLYFSTLSAGLITLSQGGRAAADNLVADDTENELCSSHSQLCLKITINNYKNLSYPLYHCLFHA